MTTIYFVRHVQAAGNIQRTFQGAIDTDISPQGEIQCQNLTDYFEDVELDKVISSPLRRAVRTGAAIVGGREIPLYTDERIKEISAGVWEGQPIDQLERDYPEAFRTWQSEPWNFAVEGSETMRQVFARCAAAVEDILSQNAGKTLAVVSHGCALRSCIAAALGLPVEGLGQVEWVRNGGVSKLVFAGDQIPGKAEFQGYTGHIDAGTILHGSTFYSRK